MWCDVKLPAEVLVEIWASGSPDERFRPLVGVFVPNEWAEAGT